jgi:peptidoglycan/LPS O-acetylase OafA/YrhL
MSTGLSSDGAVGTSARLESGRRVRSVDGLRAVAVIGVLYAHIWSVALGSPSLWIGPVDANRVLSLFGTGVDLFFVISGFCMYLMHGSPGRASEQVDLGRFIGNRFRRIAPAFYAAVLVSALVEKRHFPVIDVLGHMTFVFTLVPGLGRLAPPFWSLATEWHFYLLLPVLLVAVKRFGFARALCSAMALSVIFRVAVAAFGVEAPAGVSLDHLIVGRFVEFACGIVAGKLYISGATPPRLLRGTVGFVLGWAVSLVGRLMMTEGALRVPHLGPFIVAFSIPVLAAGYMVVVWAVVSSPSIAARVCGSPPLSAMGRISYSFYLWHWDIGMGVTQYLAARFGVGPLSPVLYTCVATIVLIPVSQMSYRLLEAPYFRRRAKQGAVDAVTVGTATDA